MNEYIDEQVKIIRQKTMAAMIVTSLMALMMFNNVAIMLAIIYLISIGINYYVYANIKEKKDMKAELLANVILSLISGNILSFIILLIAYFDQRQLIKIMKQEELNDKKSNNIDEQKKSKLSLAGFVKKEEKISPEAKKLDLIMKVGVILVMLSGFLLATSTSDIVIFDKLKPFFLLAISGMFYLLSYITKIKIKIKKTEASYYILSHLFIISFVIALGYYKTLGLYFSFHGEGAMLYTALTILISGICFRIIGNKYDNIIVKAISYVAFYLSLMEVLLFFELDTIFIIISFLIASIVGYITLDKKDKSYAPVRYLVLAISILFVYMEFIDIKLLSEFIYNIIGFILIVANVLIMSDKDKDTCISISSTISLVYVQILLTRIIQVNFESFLESSFNFYLILTITYIVLHYITNKIVKLGKIFSYTLLSLIAMNSFLSISFHYNAISSLLINLIILIYIVYNLRNTSDNNKKMYFWAQYVYIFSSLLLFAQLLNEYNILNEMHRYAIVIYFCIIALVNYIEDKYINTINLDKVLYVITILGMGLSNLIFITENSYIFNLIIMILLIAYRYYFDKIEKDNIFLNTLLIALTFLHVSNTFFIFTGSYTHMIMLVLSLLFTIILINKNTTKYVLPVLAYIPFMSMIFNLELEVEINTIICVIPTIALIHVFTKCIFDCDKKTKFILEIIAMSIIFLTYVFEVNMMYAVFNTVIAIAFICIGYKIDKFESLFYEGIALLIVNIIVQLFEYWSEIPLFVYLFLLGILLLGYTTYKELTKSKQEDKKVKDEKIVYYEAKEYNKSKNIFGIILVIGLFIIAAIYSDLEYEAEYKLEQMKFNRKLSTFIKENNLDDLDYFVVYERFSPELYIPVYTSIDPYKLMKELDIENISYYWITQEEMNKAHKRGKNYYPMHETSQFFSLDDEKSSKQVNTPLYKIKIENDEIYDFKIKTYNSKQYEYNIEFNPYEVEELDVCIYFKDESFKNSVEVTNNGKIELYLNEELKRCYKVKDGNYALINRNYYNDYYYDENNNYYYDENNNYYYEGNYYQNGSSNEFDNNIYYDEEY